MQRWILERRNYTSVFQELLSLGRYAGKHPSNSRVVMHNYGTGTSKTEELMKCLMKCDDKLSSRKKRDLRDNVVGQVVDIWKTIQNNSMHEVLDICATKLIEDHHYTCLKDCFEGSHPVVHHPAVQKIVDGMDEINEIWDDLCLFKNSSETKRQCLRNSSQIFANILSGKECTKEISNFRNAALSESSFSVEIDGKLFCELFDCPAEASKKYTDIKCRDFIYNFILKTNSWYLNAFAFGLELGLKEQLGSSMSINNEHPISTCSKLTVRRYQY
uniref:Uncharacterized protein n=1 Tax=Acrobeloides nanus TaxID=290746 RepID=A0A914EQM7_9BILA